jgi:hypothetical protein
MSTATPRINIGAMVSKLNSRVLRPNSWSGYAVLARTATPKLRRHGQTVPFPVHPAPRQDPSGGILVVAEFCC